MEKEIQQLAEKVDSPPSDDPGKAAAKDDGEPQEDPTPHTAKAVEAHAPRGILGRVAASLFSSGHRSTLRPR
jgi:hypothetical protein